MRRGRAIIAGLIALFAILVLATGSAAAQPTVGEPHPGNGSVVIDTTGDSGAGSINLHISVGNLSSGATVTFYNASDDSQIASHSVSGQNGTAVVKWTSAAASGPPQLGINRWYAIVDDGTATNTSATYEFEFPFFEVREETTGDLAQAQTYNVTFTAPFSGETERRNTTTNRISLVDPPEDLTGQNLLDIEINASDYYPRTYYLDKVGEFDEAYVLRRNTSVVETTIQLVDRTSGRYSPQSTAIQITKPTRNNNQVSGEIFGADSRTTLRLAGGDRYRLQLINHDGETRQMGYYTASRDQDFVELVVGALSIEPDDPGAYRIEAQQTEIDVGKNTSPAIVVEYVDNGTVWDLVGASTLGLDIVIHERGNESNEIFNQTFQQQDRVKIVQTLTATQSNKQWTVVYEGRRILEEDIAGTIRVGGLGALGIPVPAELLQVIGLGAILLIAGLFGGRLSQIGGIATVCVAWMLWVLDIVALPIEFLSAAAVIAVLFYAGTADSGGLYS